MVNCKLCGCEADDHPEFSFPKGAFSCLGCCECILTIKEVGEQQPLDRALIQMTIEDVRQGRVMSTDDAKTLLFSKKRQPLPEEK